MEVQASETTNQKKSSNYALVTSTHPIWHCKNAFKLDRQCVYAVCNKCYITNLDAQTSTRGTGSARRQNADKDSDESVCNHTQLQFFADTLFYKDAAIKEKKKEQNIYFPFVCIDCKRAFHS